MLISPLETSPLLFPFLRPLSVAEESFSGGKGATSSRTSRFRKTLVLPFVGYSPEARGEGGMSFMTVGHVDQTSLRPSSLRVGFLLSQAGHQALRLNPEIFLASDTIRIWSEVGTYFQPDRFYGVGPHSTDQQRENLNIRGSRIALSVRHRIKAKMEIGPWFELVSNEVIPSNEATTLKSGAVTGSRGGRTAGVGGILTIDTRNLIFNPSRGRLYEMIYASYRPNLGSDFSYDRAAFDLREYFTPLPFLTLAFQWSSQVIWGAPSFLNLSSLGGARIMRGYWDGRWKDLVSSAFQGEGRFPILWRIGGTGFISGGQVGSNISTTLQNPIRLAAGVGLRFRFDDVERIQGRMDLAWGQDSSFGYYMYLTEAF